MSEKKGLDLWLERLSYISQTGLFFLTIFTLYYTVIPVFQNASLQESIAKKEAELQEMKKEEEVLYSSLKSEYISKFKRSLFFNCNPAMKLAMQVPLPPGAGRDEQDYNDSLAVMNIDIMQCVTNALKTDAFLKRLKENDVISLNNSIETLRSRINATQKEYKALIENKGELEEIGRKSSIFVAEEERRAIQRGADVNWVRPIYVAGGARKVLADYGDRLNNIYDTIGE